MDNNDKMVSQSNRTLDITLLWYDPSNSVNENDTILSKAQDVQSKPMENDRKTHSTYNKSNKKSLIHLSPYNRSSPTKDTATSPPNNKTLSSKHVSFLKANNSHEVALYHNEVSDRHDKNCKILEKENLQKIMLTHPK